MNTMLYATTGRDATELLNETGTRRYRPVSFGALLLFSLTCTQLLVAQITPTHTVQWVEDQRQRFRHPSEAAPAADVTISAVATPDTGPEVTNLAAITAAIGYPQTAKLAHQQGTITLRILVDARGKVAQWLVPHPSKHAALQAAVIAQLPKLEFKPALKDGQAVPCWVSLPIRFQLQ